MIEDDDDEGEPIVSEGPIFCGRCNQRIRAMVHECCGILLHGQCFANHRTEEHRAR